MNRYYFNITVNGVKFKVNVNANNSVSAYGKVSGKSMEPKYVIILDFCIGALNIIKLTEEELKESENYDDFEEFLSTLEEKYGFKLNNCQWMTTETLNIYWYEDGRETD